MSEQEPRTVDFDRSDAFMELSSLAPAACFQCGTCTATCTWRELLEKPMNVRRMIHQAQLGLEQDDDLWLCTTCKMCETLCPRQVEIVDTILSMRKVAFKYRRTPDEFNNLLWNVLEEGNPSGEPRNARGEWAKDMDIKDALKGVDVLLYVGCAASYDPRLQSTARSLASILEACEVDFGILGRREMCCGDSVRSTGEHAYLDSLIKKNVETFKFTGAKRIVTVSPHCYDMFSGPYRNHGLDIDVVHYTQLLNELWSSGDLELPVELASTITFHDPCYLARYHGIIEEPRALLDGMKGVNFVEMKDSGANTVCCGGGGGRMWLESESPQRLSDLTIRQASDVSADVIVNACPYCVQNIEDSAKVAGSKVKVMDLAEIVAQAMGLPQR